MLIFCAQTEKLFIFFENYHLLSTYRVIFLICRGFYVKNMVPEVAGGAKANGEAYKNTGSEAPSLKELKFKGSGKEGKLNKKKSLQKEGKAKSKPIEKSKSPESKVKRTHKSPR